LLLIDQDEGGAFMREEFQPAIDALQKDLADLERKVIEAKTTINKLCELAGGTALYPDVGSPSAATITTIRADTFYGKVLTTAAREYLEMRKVQNLGPATTRDIYDAIISGGFEFETDNANNAMTGMRQTMGKNSSIFHRLPNGNWGLTSWYERVKAKKAKNTSGQSEDDENNETETEAADDTKTPAA
jgi:hypothetical protein